MSEASTDDNEKLPPFVVEQDGVYRLQRGKAWAFAIAYPFVMPAGGLLLLVGVLRFVLGYALDDRRWWASMLHIFAMFACLNAGFSIAYVLKQQRAIRRGVARLPRFQFSLLELFVIATSLAFYAGIAGFHHRSQIAQLTPAMSLRLQATQLLGLDGGVKDGPGGLEVWIQDPTFDDKRLADFTELAQQRGLLREITSLRFLPWGSGPLGRASFPLVTDESIETLENWPALKVLEARLTRIPPEYRTRFTPDTSW